MKIALLLAMGVIFTLSGCANYYTTYYRGLSGDQVAKNSNFIMKDKPTITFGNDPKTDAQQMLENGYVLIGYSSFIAPNNRHSGTSALRGQAESVHASRVLLYTHPYDEMHKNVPFFTPSYSSGTVVDNYGNSATYSGSSSTMSFVPVIIYRNSFLAAFWVKEKSLILGVHTRNLTEDEHREIDSNSGVKVLAVMKKSPAFYANIFKGDIILKINSEDVFDTVDLNRKLHDHAGDQIALSLLRNGKPLGKQVQTNPQGAGIIASPPRPQQSPPARDKTILIPGE